MSQTYAVKYLNYFAKAASLSSYVTLSLTDQNPIEVRFDILEPVGGGSAGVGHSSSSGGGGGDDGDDSAGAAERGGGSRSRVQNQARSRMGHVKFFLAPKMDDDALQDEGGDGPQGGRDEETMED